ncbi:hypothetical protein FQZ97_862540 [compost metagenome]
MGDQHDGQVQLAVDLRQQLQHRGGGLRVEGAGGLVTQQDLRLGGQGAGDADPLLLSAGQLRRVFVGVLAEADPRQQFGHPRLHGAARQQPGQLQRQGDVGGDGLRRQQVEVLEDHPDPLAETPQARRVQCGDVFAIDLDASAGGLLQTVDQAQQGALAGTGMTDDAEHFATGDPQVARLQGGDILATDAIRLVNLMEVDHALNLLGLSSCRVGIKAG